MDSGGAPSMVVHPAPPGRKTLANVRQALTFTAECYYITKNYLDHAVRFTERLIYGQKYLPLRLSQYQGQKKVALCYHGYMQGRPGFERLERLLESKIFNIFAVAGGYQPYSQDIRRSADYEREVLAWVLAETDATEVYLIGHSQGGLVARYMVQKLDAAALVKKCIFLATPHMGTWAGVAGAANWLVTRAASLVPGFPLIEGESALQMLPGSLFLRDLNETPLPEGMDFLNLYNQLDPLVWPSRFARLPYTEATNILFKKIGHLQSLYAPQELEIMLRALMFPTGHRWALEREILEGQEVLERRVMGEGGQRYREIVTSSD